LISIHYHCKRDGYDWRIPGRLDYHLTVKVFLSYALPPYDDLLPSRLRANAIAYDVEVIVPGREAQTRSLNTVVRNQIKSSAAVIAFVAQYATNQDLNWVNWELQEATRLGKPVIALVESQGLIQNVPVDRTVIFDRLDFGKHQQRLREVLTKIQKEQEGKELITAIAALGLIALGLYTFGELTKD